MAMKKASGKQADGKVKKTAKSAGTPKAAAKPPKAQDVTNAFTVQRVAVTIHRGVGGGEETVELTPVLAISDAEASVRGAILEVLTAAGRAISEARLINDVVHFLGQENGQNPELLADFIVFVAGRMPEIARSAGLYQLNAV